MSAEAKAEALFLYWNLILLMLYARLQTPPPRPRSHHSERP